MWNSTDQVQVYRNNDKIKNHSVFFSGETHRVLAARATALAFQGLDTEKRDEDKYFFVFEFEFPPTESLTESVNLKTFGATFESLKALWLEVHSIAFAMITRIIESLRHLTWQRLLSCEVTSNSSLCLCTECIQALASIGISKIDPNVCWCST